MLRPINMFTNTLKPVHMLQHLGIIGLHTFTPTLPKSTLKAAPESLVYGPRLLPPPQLSSPVTGSRLNDRQGIKCRRKTLRLPQPMRR